MYVDEVTANIPSYENASTESKWYHECVLTENYMNKNRPSEEEYGQYSENFTVERSSDFHLSGDQLKGALIAQKEYRIHPPFANFYNLDIAILGPKIHSEKIILGAIEIEHTHEVDMLKTLLCKSLGFPLFTLDKKDVN